MTDLYSRAVLTVIAMLLGLIVFQISGARIDEYWLAQQIAETIAAKTLKVEVGGYPVKVQQVDPIRLDGPITVDVGNKPFVYIAGGEVRAMAEIINRLPLSVRIERSTGEVLGR